MCAPSTKSKFYDSYGNRCKVTQKMCIRWLWFFRLTLCWWPLTALCRWQMQKLLSFGTICLSKLHNTNTNENTRKLVLKMSNNGRFGILPVGIRHALNKRCNSDPIQAHTQNKNIKEKGQLKIFISFNNFCNAIWFDLQYFAKSFHRLSWMKILCS